MKNFFFALALIFSFSGTAEVLLAEFDVDENLVNKIFEDVMEQPAVAEPTSQAKIRASVSFRNFSELTLSNKYFEVSHVSAKNTAPSFKMAAALPVTRLGQFSVLAELGLGYGYRETQTPVLSSDGTPYTDLVRLHALPVSVALIGEYNIPQFKWVTPFVELASGAQYIYQSGRLDGLDQGFWIPYYEAAAGATLFSNAANPDVFFGGLHASASTFGALGGAQALKGWALNLGVNFVL